MAGAPAEHSETLCSCYPARLVVSLTTPSFTRSDTLHADSVCSKHYNDDGLEPCSAEFEGRTRQMRVIYAP